MSEKLDSGKMLICELCKKSFKQKCDYDKHKNAKRPCIPMTEIQKITQMKDVSNDNKSRLTSIFKNCLNILRDNEGLIGEKGLRTLSHLLILKLIEMDYYYYTEDQTIFDSKIRNIIDFDIIYI